MVKPSKPTLVDRISLKQKLFCRAKQTNRKSFLMWHQNFSQLVYLVFGSLRVSISDNLFLCVYTKTYNPHPTFESEKKVT